MQLGKRVDRSRTWSVGIVLYANIRHAMFVKPFRFRSMTPFITWSPNGLLLTTILPENNSYHLLCNHYRVSDDDVRADGVAAGVAVRYGRGVAPAVLRGADVVAECFR